MKKLLLLFIISELILNIEYAYSQITSYYLDSTSTWYESDGSVDIVNSYINHSKYFINGDTILSGNTYYKIYRDGIDSTISLFSGNVTVNYVYSDYQGGLREDSVGGFYFFPEFQSAESLLFDFSLSIGDTLQSMLSNWGCNNPPMTVTSISTVYLGTSPLNKFNLLQGPSLYEGIGGSGGVFRSSSLCQLVEGGGCLIAYKKGNDSLYINCGLGVTSVFEPVHEENLIDIFPNPAANELTVNIGPVAVKEIEIYDTVGEVVLNYQLPIINSQFSINVSQLLPGFYFVALKDQIGHKAVRKIVKM